MARFRGLWAAAVLVAVIMAASNSARASLSGEMQGAIADMVSSAIATEDDKGLGAAINDLCAAHPDIKEEIVAAVAAELAGQRPPGFCAGRSEPCLDLDSVMDTLLYKILVRHNTAAREREVSKRESVVLRDNTGECGGGNCTSGAAEPPASSSPSPAAW